MYPTTTTTRCRLLLLLLLLLLLSSGRFCSATGLCTTWVVRLSTRLGIFMASFLRLALRLHVRRPVSTLLAVLLRIAGVLFLLYSSVFGDPGSLSSTSTSRPSRLTPESCIFNAVHDQPTKLLPLRVVGVRPQRYGLSLRLRREADSPRNVQQSERCEHV